MSYRKTWSKTWLNTEFKDPVHLAFPFAALPERTLETGFRSYVISPHRMRCEGLWKTRSPINILSVMPGTQRKIIKVTVKGYHGMGGIGADLISTLKIIGNGSVIFNSGKLSHGAERWETSTFELGTDLTGFNNLSLDFYQNTAVLLFETEQLDADITVTAEYYVDIPPVTADVEILVVDKNTDMRIKNAFIRLMSGLVVVDEGYTDGQGLVKFININEGSYILSARATGYHSTELAIKIEPPMVAYTLKLVKVAKEPTPWYVYAGLAGVGLVSVVAIGGVLIRKPTPIMVVR